MKKPLLPAVVLACVLAVLAGCSSSGDATPTGEVELGTSQSSAPDEPSAGPSDEPGQTDGPPADFDDEGHEAHAGRVVAQDDEQRAVADAWLAYWQVRLDAFGGPELDAAALGEVATGKAAEQVISYVGYLQQEKLYTRGDVLLGAAAIKVKGSSATLRSCMQNLTVDVRQSNDRPVETLNPFYTFRGVLQRASETWVVTDVVRVGTAPCRP